MLLWLLAFPLSWTWSPEEDGRTQERKCAFQAVLTSCQCPRHPGMSMRVFLVTVPGLRPETQEQGQHRGPAAPAASDSSAPAERSHNQGRWPLMLTG